MERLKLFSYLTLKQCIFKPYKTDEPFLNNYIFWKTKKKKKKLSRIIGIKKCNCYSFFKEMFFLYQDFGHFTMTHQYIANELFCSALGKLPKKTFFNGRVIKPPPPPRV